MKKIFSFIAVCAIALSAAAVLTSGKKADKDTQAYRYDIEYVKTAGDGIVEVRVASYAKKQAVALEQCTKNAVHGVIFKGYAGGGSAQSALSKEPGGEAAHADFYKAFFADNGGYRQYVTAVQSESATYMKVGKEFKVSETIYVNKKALRKALESAGIIRGLSSGF